LANAVVLGCTREHVHGGPQAEDVLLLQASGSVHM
jgi:hypothetical protein